MSNVGCRKSTPKLRASREPPKDKQPPPVIVIGAGGAGLAAAYELAMTGKRVVVLEYGDRVGGNIRTVYIKGKPVDVGTVQMWDWYWNVMELSRELEIDKLIHPVVTTLLVHTPTVTPRLSSVTPQLTTPASTNHGPSIRPIMINENDHKDDNNDNTNDNTNVDNKDLMIKLRHDHVINDRARIAVSYEHKHPHDGRIGPQILLKSSTITAKGDENVTQESLCKYMANQYPERYSLDYASLPEQLAMLNEQGPILASVPLQTLSFYNPEPHLPEMPPNLTMSQFMDNVPVFRELCRKTFEGYLFGNTTEVPIYTFLNTMIRSSNEFSFGNMSLFPEALAKRILLMNGTIRLNAQVLNINTRAKTVQVRFKIAKKSDDTGDVESKTRTNLQEWEYIERNIPYEAVVMAAPAGSVTIDGKLPFQIVKKVDPSSLRPQFRYTQAFAIIIEIDKELEAGDLCRPKGPASTGKSWDFAFEEIDESKSIELVGTMCLKKLGLSHHITLLFVVRFGTLPTGWSLAELQKDQTKLVDIMARSDLLWFNNVKITEICSFEWFSHAMPVYNYAAQQAIKEMQGGGQVWFSGQGQAGGHPSLEFAVYTGRLAALKIIDPEKANKFEQHWRDRDLAVAKEQQDKLITRINFTNSMMGKATDLLIDTIRLVYPRFMR
jgi:hypothetical protein